MDAAVAVISAVDGVEVNTEKTWGFATEMRRQLNLDNVDEDGRRKEKEKQRLKYLKRTIEDKKFVGLIMKSPNTRVSRNRGRVT